MHRTGYSNPRTITYTNSGTDILGYTDANPYPYDKTLADNNPHSYPDRNVIIYRYPNPYADSHAGAHRHADADPNSDVCAHGHPQPS